jgi:hypothetical protein
MFALQSVNISSEEIDLVMKQSVTAEKFDILIFRLELYLI